MGYRLYRHVLDHAPADLTSGERLVLLVIADDANDNTRIGWPGVDLIMHRSGLGETGVKRALGRLAERGLEVRVPIAEDAKGRPIFAVRGRRTTYRVPVFPERTDRPMPTPQAPQSGPEWGAHGTGNDTETDKKGGPTGPEWGAHRPGMGGPQAPPLPQSPHSPHHARAHEPDSAPAGPTPDRRTTREKKTTKQPLDIVMDLGATETEAQLVIDRLQATSDIGNLPGFLAHAAANGSLQGHLDAVRNSRRRRATVELCDEHTRDRSTCPWCPPAERTAS